ncbi:MAG: hypothetical protein IPK17_08795 [Chloroflexi bacterium]|uniref:hypothetical protein n=1 Tax=Candidatus Flexifilum breve TaxID=3140694 RepID=UPI0031352006|nr:hypothetical protein [Chloroflexota bacterium]
MKRLILLVTLMLVLFAATAVPTFADGSVFFSGTLDISSPAMVDRPDGCGALYGGSGPFYYTTQTVNLTDAAYWGFYDFYSWVDIVVIIYPEGGFDPLNPLANCVTMLDYAQSLSLTPGSYTFVTTSYDDGGTGSYEFAFGYPGLANFSASEWLDILPDGRPDDDGNGCTQIADDPAGYLYGYEPFTPEISGVYTYYDLYEEEETIDIWFSIYQGGFEATTPLANCLANFDDDGQIYLQAGVTYIIMISTLEPGEPCGCYSEGVAFLFMTLGSGSASVDACIYPLPTNAVVYQIPAGAPVFYQPDLATQLPWALPAGTWYITDFSGDFAHVWIACTGQQIWVPTNAVYIPQ